MNLLNNKKSEKMFNLPKVLFLITIMGLSFAHAVNTGELYFPAEHNGTSLLNQKFEFHIKSKDTIQLGNLLINTNDIQMNLIFNKEEKEYQLEFKGPSQFLKNSTIIIRDPSGRSLWQKKVPRSKDLTTIKDKNLPEEIINEVSSFTLSSGVDDLLEQASGSIFVNYCSYFEDPLHKINICSPDYKFTQINDNEWKQETLPSSNKDPIIQVNGIEVNEIGQIQLSNEIPVIQFSARLSSGMLIEIRTGVIPIELLDLIFLDSDNNSIYEKQPDFVKLTLREKQTSEIFVEKNIWESKVNLKIPFLYIQADNQVPLKQELKFNSELPSIKERPTVVQDIQKTYDNYVDIELNNIKGSIRTLTPKDNTFRKKSSWYWSLKNLVTNKSTPHLIELRTKNDKKFVGAYEVRRGLPFLTNISMSYNTSSSEELKFSGSGYKLGGKYHFTSFFGNMDPLNLIRWTFEFNLESINLITTTLKNSILDSYFYFGYRFSSGFHHETPSAEFRLGQLVSKYSSTSDSFVSSGISNNLGAGLIYTLPLLEESTLFGNQVNFGAHYFPNIKYSNSTDAFSKSTLFLKSLHTINVNLFWSWEIEHQQNKNSNQDSFHLGINTLY